jgi:hypothetical protein
VFRRTMPRAAYLRELGSLGLLSPLGVSARRSPICVFSGSHCPCSLDCDGKLWALVALREPANAPTST